MTTPLVTAQDVLAAAAGTVGFDITGATVIRDGSNVMYRLPRGIVARVGRPGTRETAEREVRVSRWLVTVGLPVVHALDGVPQPTMAGNRPVTWWELLPEHRSGTPGELGAVLRSLHSLTPPEDLRLPLLDFEHVSFGHADWDLILIAVDHTDFARLTTEDYHSFVDAYGGHDAMPRRLSGS